MSDNYLRLIPTDPNWVADAAAAERAAATLSTLVPGSDSVQAELYDQVTFIDQGTNFERLSCPACRAELETGWWSEQMEQSGAVGFTELAVVTPCCGTRTSLNDLVYDWPAGFARAELSVLNPQLVWLHQAALAQVGAELGHPLRQVRAHY